MSEADRRQKESAQRHAGGLRPLHHARTCVGCGERVEEREELVRLIVSPGGEVAVDARGGGFGRGAHVHPRPACLERAVQRGLSRSARAKVCTIYVEPRDSGDEGVEGASMSLDTRTLAQAIVRASDRRIQGLLTAALRSKKAALGAEAVTDACQRGEADLVVVACDAAAAADLTEVRRAIAEGRAIAWGTKELLGAIAGPPRREGASGAGIAVLAIASASIARALRDAAQIVASLGPTAAGAPVPALRRGGPKRGPARESPPARAEDGESSPPSACAPGPKSGEQESPHGDETTRSSRAHLSPGDRDRGAPTDQQTKSGRVVQANRKAPSRGWHRERGGSARGAERRAKVYAGDRQSDG